MLRSLCVIFMCDCSICVFSCAACWRRSSAQEQSLALFFPLREGSALRNVLRGFWCVCVCVLMADLNALGCLRCGDECEGRRGGKARAVCIFEFSPGFCVLPVVVNFSASLCCHVLFPVDHALLLPPPNSTHLRFLITLTHSSVCVGLHRWAGAPAQAA